MIFVFLVCIRSISTSSCLRALDLWWDLPGRRANAPWTTITMISSFTCLYTHQKTKKAKTWQDGVVRYMHEYGKAVLYDDPTSKKNQKLDSLFAAFEDLTQGAELDFERHLVTIEERLPDEAVLNNGNKQEDASIEVPPKKLTTLNRLLNMKRPIPHIVSQLNITTAPATVSIPVGQSSIETVAPKTVESAPPEFKEPPLKRTKPNVKPIEPLRFPTKEECNSILATSPWQNHASLQRQTTIPLSFKDVNQYKDTFLRAMTESIQVQLTMLACQYYNLGNTQEQTARQRGVPFYTSCNLSNLQIDPNRERFQLGRKGNFFLNVSSKEPSSCYSKEDIWIVSSQPTFDAALTFLAKSVYYGPSANGNVELTPLTGKDSVIANLLCTQPTCALRGVNAASEFLCMEALKSHLGKTSMLSHIVDYTSMTRKRSSGFRPPSRQGLIQKQGIEIYTTVLEQTIQEFSLNEDQARVLRAFAKSIALHTPQPDAPGPITLAFGVFGAGKSFLVAITIIFLGRLKQYGAQVLQQPEKYKVLIASMTNVAVDRILLALLKFGYTDFVRIGSMKKMAKKVLPFAAQSQTNDKEEMHELESLLREDLDPKELKLVQETIRKFKSSENKSLVKSCFCLATTCISAATSPSIDGAVTCPIVILDECSQMTEPMSILPIATFACERVLLVGDSKQLPPTITSNSKVIGLERTLFERLHESGCPSTMLRTQYRCHPLISAISNAQFYNNQLRDGKTGEELYPLYDELPTLALVNVCGQEQTVRGSMVNRAEVDVIVSLVRRLLVLNVSGYDIGVICLYKAQSDAIQEALRNKRVQVSTVDAFQGGEKTIVILSTVRTAASGFIDDPRRVNVAVTRAMRHLWVVGNESLLRDGRVWGKILSHHLKNVLEGMEFLHLLTELEPLELRDDLELQDDAFELCLSVPETKEPPVEQQGEPLRPVQPGNLFTNLRNPVMPVLQAKETRNNKGWLSTWSGEEELV